MHQILVHKDSTPGRSGNHKTNAFIKTDLREPGTSFWYLTKPTNGMQTLKQKNMDICHFSPKYLKKCCRDVAEQKNRIFLLPFLN